MRKCLLALATGLSLLHQSKPVRSESTVEGVIAGTLDAVVDTETHARASEALVKIAGRDFQLSYWSPSSIRTTLQENLRRRVIIEFRQGEISPESEAQNERRYGTLGFVAAVRSRSFAPPACGAEIRPEPPDDGAFTEVFRNAILVTTQRRTGLRPAIVRLGLRHEDGSYREVNVVDVELYGCFVQLTEAGRPVDLRLSSTADRGLRRVTGLGLK